MSIFLTSGAIPVTNLAKDPKKRYARGNDLQRDLETIASRLGLRASTGAVAEFLLSLFPELEQRTSDASGETQIRKIQPLPAVEPRRETTRIPQDTRSAGSSW